MEIDYNRIVKYSSDIKFIRDHISTVELSETDLNHLRNALNVIKLDVIFRIVEAGVLQDPTINQQIEETREYLRGEIERVSNEMQNESVRLEYPPYKEREYGRDISEWLITDQRNVDRRQYEEDRNNFIRNEQPSIRDNIERLDRQFQDLNRIQTNLQNKDEFLRSFLQEHLRLPHTSKTAYRDVIRACYNGMLVGFNTPEFARTPVKGENGEEEWNRSIITQVPGEFGVYTIDSAALTEFLNLIRDTELANELINYDQTYQTINRYESDCQRNQDMVNQLRETIRILSNPELCNDVENMIERMAAIRAERDRMVPELVTVGTSVEDDLSTATEAQTDSNDDAPNPPEASTSDVNVPHVITDNQPNVPTVGRASWWLRFRNWLRRTFGSSNQEQEQENAQEHVTEAETETEENIVAENESVPEIVPEEETDNIDYIEPSPLPDDVASTDSPHIPIEEQINTLFDEYRRRADEDYDFRILCNIYALVGSDNHYPSARNLVDTRVMDQIDFRNQFDAIDRTRGDTPRREYLQNRLERRINDEISQLNNWISEAQSNIETSRAQREEDYQHLSERARQIIDAAPGGRVNMEGIDRYLNKPGPRFFLPSPYISALILDAFLHMDEINTLEDADNIGITINEEDRLRVNTEIEKAIGRVREALDVAQGKAAIDEIYEEPGF